MSFIIGCVAFLSLWIHGTAWASQSNPCVVAREIEAKAIALMDHKPNDALKAFQNAFTICSTDVAIGFNLALAHYQNGQKKEALATWNKLHDLFPDHLKTHANLAWMQFEMGNDKKALRLASEGFGKHPGQLSLAHTKIFALFRQSQYLEAYDWIMRMRDLEQEEPGTGLTGAQVERWRHMAAGYVIETLWRKFRQGERLDALKNAINLLVKEYPQEKIFVQVKDQLLQAFTDPEAEIPFPIPLPHEIWAKSGDLDNQSDVLDTKIATLPVLAPWQKRTDAYALVVGINHYKRIKARHYADRDAINVHRLLTRRGVFLDDADHVRLRLNAAADLRTLQQDLEWLVKQGQLNPNAMLLLFFSGLGAPWGESAKSSDAFLLPADAQLSTLDPTHALSMTRLKKSLADLPNKEIAILLDVCFNNTPACAWKNDQPAVAADRTLFLHGKPMAVAAEKQEASIHGPGQQGAFTWHLLKAMLGEADGFTLGNKDGWVDLSEVFGYLKAGLAHHSVPMDPIVSVPSRMRLTRTGGEQ
ncbi:MAG: caspase family protein [Magnetococcus sp. YQC-5]